VTIPRADFKSIKALHNCPFNETQFMQLMLKSPAKHWVQILALTSHAQAAFAILTFVLAITDYLVSDIGRRKKNYDTTIK
jgi:hypothetical protein